MELKNIAASNTFINLMKICGLNVQVMLNGPTLITTVRPDPRPNAQQTKTVNLHLIQQEKQPQNARHTTLRDRRGTFVALRRTAGPHLKYRKMVYSKKLPPSANLMAY